MEESPAPDGLPKDMLQTMRETLAAIGSTYMPFGKYGPEHYPPNGLPIYELPAEYLQWFQTKGGFPKGKLGRLLAAVLEIKQTGAEIVFETFRKARRETKPDLHWKNRRRKPE